jgi:hypothetical protein
MERVWEIILHLFSIDAVTMPVAGTKFGIIRDPPFLEGSDPYCLTALPSLRGAPPFAHALSQPLGKPLRLLTNSRFRRAAMENAAMVAHLPPERKREIR